MAILQHPWGIGMPAWLRLHEFAVIVHDAFDVWPVLCGSALRTKRPRDIDIRCVLSLTNYKRLVGPVSEFGHVGTRWASLSLAYAALAQQMTGLRRPIDFQLQDTSHGWAHNDDPIIVLDGRAKAVS